MEFFGFGLTGAYAGRPHAEALGDMFALIRQADEQGLDGWFFAEHHGNSEFSISSAPNLYIAAIATMTTRLRLGNMVTVLPFHHPLRVAEEIRTLDLLSGGRVEMGLGRGHLPDEQRAFGIDRDRSAEMFETALGIVRDLLDGKRLDYDTEWWRGQDVVAVPEAVRDEVPIWVTSSSPHSVERCAELGVNCATALLTGSIADERLAAYRAAWSRHQPGRSPGRFAVSATVSVGETTEEAVRHIRTDLERHQDFYGRAVAAPLGDKDGSYAAHRDLYRDFVASSLDSLIDDGLLIVGTVEQCCEQVARLQDRGFDRLLCIFQSEPGDIRYASASMRRFCTEVIPVARERRPQPDLLRVGGDA